MNLIGIKTMAFHALYDGVPKAQDSKETDDGKCFKTILFFVAIQSILCKDADVWNVIPDFRNQEI